MDKGDVYTHTHHSRMLVGLRKNEIMPFMTTWVDLEGIMLSEINQMKKDKYCTMPLICGIVQYLYKNNKTTLMGTENKLVVARGKSG